MRVVSCRRVLVGITLLFVITALGASGCSSSSSSKPRSTQASKIDGAVPATWFRLLYDLVRDESLSPPVASRIFGYQGVALYESTLPGMPGYRSLVGQLEEFAAVPEPDRRMRYDWPTVANSALAVVALAMFEGGSPATLDAIAVQEEFWIGLRGFVEPSEVIDRSIAHGQAVGDAVVAWAASDGYAMWSNCAYTPPVGPGIWEPTPPAFAPALQPCWGQIRPFALPMVGMCNVIPPTAYSEDPLSQCYVEALEVYETEQNLTPEQEIIAFYWADDPGATGTPPGHWVSILVDFISDNDITLDVAAEAFARLGIGVADAFVSCWFTKYDYDYLRPVTYVNDFIDAGWLPRVTTPPFPEYTSGHSVQSGAAAYMLTDLFGEVPFTDRTHVDLGMPARSFMNFDEAADEAAISRLYGGIHFRPAIDLGVDQGRCVAESILDRVRFR